MDQITGAQDLGRYLCELANEHEVQGQEPAESHSDVKAAQTTNGVPNTSKRDGSSDLMAAQTTRGAPVP